MQKFKKFLKAHFAALPDDLEQPFVKKFDLTLKIIGITALFVAIAIIVSGASNFYANYQNLRDNTQQLLQNSPDFASMERIKISYEIARDEIVYNFFYRIILGIGIIMINMLTGPMLNGVYWSFTIPDKIYLRCFSTKEEKEKKRKFGKQ